MTAERNNGGASSTPELVQAVRGALEDAADLSAAAPKLLEALCEQLQWDAAVLSQFDPETRMLRRAGAWRRTGVPEDMVAGDQGARASAAAAAGFFGTVSHPIRGAEGVLGLIELYRRDFGSRDANVLRLLEQVGEEIRAFLEREDVDDLPVVMEDDPGAYRALVEQVPVVTYVYDLDDALTARYVSPQIHKLVGISAARWVRDPDARTRAIHPADRERVLATYRRCRTDGRAFSMQYRLRTPARTTVWVRDSATVLPGGNGAAGRLHGSLVELTAELRGGGGVASGARQDDLTGVPNAEMFREVLDQVLGRAARHDVAVTVLAIDVDDFGPMNDTLGQETGDELLRLFAARLRDNARDADLVGRLENDTFLLLLTGHQMGGGASPRERANDALLAAQVEASRILETLRQTPFDLEGSEFFVSASIGISAYPVDAQDGATMVRHAVGAVDRSKKYGPGGYVLYSAEAADPVRGLSFTTRLRNAVDRRQWVLHYHPIVDLVSSSMVGVEALLRWKAPDGTLVPPGEFLLAAEDMGLIGAIGDWVLEEICRQSRLWRDQDIELDASINFSPRQLWQPDVVRMVMNHLEATGIDPGTLVIEITESAAVADPEKTLRVLREFSEAGLRLAIDDFGTSSSSIGRLKDLPVDILKVDRSFVANLPGDRDAARMARAIIQLGTSLDMVPLAEAIDSEEQRAFLLRAGCPLGQGYLFSKPMPADEITKRCLTEAGFDAAGLSRAGGKLDLGDAEPPSRIPEVVSPAAVAVADPDPEPEADAEAEAEAEVEDDPEPEAEPEIEDDPEPDAEAEAEIEDDPEPEADPEPEPEIDPEDEDVPEVGAEDSEPESESEDEADEAEPEAEAEDEADPEPEPEESEAEEPEPEPDRVESNDADDLVEDEDEEPHTEVLPPSPPPSSWAVLDEDEEVTPVGGVPRLEDPSEAPAVRDPHAAAAATQLLRDLAMDDDDDDEDEDDSRPPSRPVGARSHGRRESSGSGPGWRPWRARDGHGSN